ncbi:MAG: (2Fe-2S) ferredoxin domain-containing protein [Kiritimatiellales bacterium]
MSRTEEKKLKITVCMGSSCFARGNGANLEMIEEWIALHGIEADVDLSGTRCEGRCAAGPNLLVNGRLFERVDRETLLDILNEHCTPAELRHE